MDDLDSKLVDVLRPYALKEDISPNNTSSLRSMLKKQFPEYLTRINSIVLAQADGIVSSLVAQKGEEDLSTVFLSLSKVLAGHTGLDLEESYWSVMIWAKALGLFNEPASDTSIASNGAKPREEQEKQIRNYDKKGTSFSFKIIVMLLCLILIGMGGFYLTNEKRTQIVESKEENVEVKPETSNTEITYQIYNNERFGFSVEVPSNFVPAHAFENNDGQGWNSPDGHLQLVVSGLYNTLQTDISDAKRKEIEKLGDSFSYEDEGNDWYRLGWYENNKNIIKKVFMGKGAINTIVFAISSDYVDKYEEVVAVIEESFKPGELNVQSFPEKVASDEQANLGVTADSSGILEVEEFPSTGIITASFDVNIFGEPSVSGGWITKWPQEEYVDVLGIWVTRRDQEAILKKDLYAKANGETRVLNKGKTVSLVKYDSKSRAFLIIFQDKTDTISGWTSEANVRSLKSLPLNWNNFFWYKVSTSSGKTGWVEGEFISIKR